MQEVLVEVDEHLGSGGVDVGDRLAATMIQAGARFDGCQPSYLVAEGACVGEQQRGIEAEDGEPGQVFGCPVEGRVVISVRMEGRAVFKHAVAMISDVVFDVFKSTGYTAADIDWFVPHQANKRIIDDSARKLGIAPEKIVTTVDRHGNTSAASIPLAVAVAVADGRIKRGDLLLLEAMGGGFTWGACAIALVMAMRAVSLLTRIDPVDFELPSSYR